ncbi:SusC/RagA family TonB-linked outer membrane protein [Sphingobacterium lactis]|uniref:SusC/RagA family TonB-linked outer membrane protein n=1 Tax=Sphingobacterium lactis TaxID=797291 RepID=UPI003DA5314F
MKHKLLCFIVAFVCLIGQSIAQTQNVSGTVTSSADGQPLSGVSVRVVGTTNAAQTDGSGKYTLSNVAAGSTLSFSYIGFTSQTVTLGNSNTINIELSQAGEALDEVVVVAYGTAKKSEVTGSMATMGAEDLEKRTVTNVSNALAGMAPGISVSSGNGQPGSGASIRLRGIGSMSASSSPLYVVDGAVFDGNIGDINSDDIESISILKDATSAALYGSRAGNGVIMITTKKGRGATRFNVGLTQGITQRGIEEYETVGINDYYPTAFQAIKHSRMFPTSGTPATEEAANRYAVDNIKRLLAYNPFNVADNEVVDLNGVMNPNASLKYNDFDWFDAIQRVGKRTNANVNLSGSNDKTDYYVSLGYLNDEGYILNSDLQRFNGRMNVNSQIKDWLKAGVNISGTMSEGSMASDAATGNAASYVNPFSFIRGLGSIYPVHAFDATTGAPVINEVTGEHYYDYGMHPGAVNRPSGASPGRHVIYETILNTNYNKRAVLGGRAFVEIKFLKDFTFTPSVSVDLTNRNRDYSWNNRVGDGVSYNGLGSFQNDITKSYTFNQVLQYRKSFDLHNLTALAGHENYDYEFSTRNTTKTGQITSGITELDNYVTPLSSGGYKNVNRLESYFGKASYNYDQKYYADASFRMDGSSIFDNEKRWGKFFSVGAAWAINKEAFLADASWINDLRLKASYGQVGNNNLLDVNGNRIYYGYQALYNLGWSNGGLPGTILSSLPNPNLTWESSNTFNVGVNFAFLNNRLRGEMEFYKRGSDQLLLSVPRALSSAVSSEFMNVGSMYNTGFELSLSGDIVRNENFTWTMTKNITTFKNEITKMPAENPVITSGNKRREVGRDYYSFWLREYAGVDATDGSSLYTPADNAPASALRTVDGKQYVTNQNFAKFVYSGTSIPDLMGSIMNSFSYKDFSLSFLLNYQIGGQIYDSQYASLMSTNAYGKSYHVDAMNAWTTSNTGSTIPRLDQANNANINAASTRWLIDASYLSITNVNFQYKLPTSLVNKIDLSSARVFFTGENLALFSKRTGMNPTEGFDGSVSTTYLPTRIFSLGINVGF